MYILKPGIKKNPQKRWASPDRIFFGYGACHILAGVYLRNLPFGGFYAERIIPAEGFAGGHAWVTDGKIVFDYHGYSSRAKLIAHHSKGWCERTPGWRCDIEIVDFDLLDTCKLNRRKMLGPDQYLHDAVPRADRFIGRIDHVKGATRARSTV